MVKLTGITKAYDGKKILDNADLDIPDGITCLMGPSGRGKTTLLRILTGLEMPDEGQVEGRPDRIAVLFQEDRLVETLTVGMNLRAALGRDHDPAAALECLQALEIGDCLQKQVLSLSGGMKRRAALARALLYPAPLLVLDEPFQGLDENTHLTAIKAVQRYGAGRAVLIVTHDPHDTELLGGITVTLCEGKICGHQ